MFAKTDIPEGTRIIEYAGRRLTKAQSARRADVLLQRAARNGAGAVYIFELNQRYDIDGSVWWNPAKFINHSCDPNCEAQIIRGVIWFVALRDIPSGEEITFNYGYDVEHWREHPCRCGAPNCVGHIVDQEQWPKLGRLKKKQAARKKPTKRATRKRRRK